MAVMLTCKDLDLEYPAKHVLNQVTLGIDSGDRIGIVGNNGGGKSTLLRVLAGQVEPDSGRVIQTGNCTFGMLGQRDSFSDDDIVRDQLQDVEGHTWEANRKAREIVEALIGDVSLDAKIKTLSGGQRRRVDLARLLIGDWDILMLDEPTNHLDITTISWLAYHLKNRWTRNAGALLVVTHDRWFLDEVCLRMWEVHDGNVLPFEGGYSAYIMQRVERARLEALAKQKRENQLRKELAWLSRGAQARRSKPKFHLEAAQELISDVPPVRNPIELKAMATARLGKQVLELFDVCLDIDGKRILSDVTWNIGPGDRIGILGENGAGKTSLLNMLRGSIRPTLGHMKTGRTVQFAMLSQNLVELAPIEDDQVRVVCSRYKTYYEVEGRKMTPTALLERMGFSRDELQSRVKDLSGGQRRRLQLLLILFDEPNVLILDEPGNDLDTDMLAATEDLLDTWPGTLIVVSHDRFFLERVTDDLYAVIDSHIVHMPGGVDEYLQAEENMRLRKADARKASEKAKAQVAAQAKSAQSSQAAPSGAKLHALRKQIASTERKMQTQEERVTRAEDALAQADPYDFESLQKAQAEVDAQKSALMELEELWLTLNEQLPCP